MITFRDAATLDQRWRTVQLRRVTIAVTNPHPDRRMTRSWSAAPIIAVGTVIEHHQPTSDRERAYFRRGYSTDDVYEGQPLYELLALHSDPMPYTVRSLFNVCNVTERGAAYVIERFIENGWCSLADVVNGIDAWNEEDDA